MSAASDELAQLRLDVAAAQKGDYSEGSRRVGRMLGLTAMYKRMQYLEQVVGRESGSSPSATLGVIDNPI